MRGWNVNGEFVDFTNKCSNCQHPMPLPQMAGKYCPRCGVKEPGSRIVLSRPFVAGSCIKCSAPNQQGHYCTNCGTKLR